MRLFVSVDVPELADDVAGIQEAFADASGLSLTDPGQAHLTLKFLGDTGENRLPALEDAIESAVSDAAVGPFDVRFGGLGVFPSLEYISVVWLGLRDGHGTTELRRLHEAIEERTVGLGFEPADHSFTPHVTLARMEHAGSKDLVQRVVSERDPDVGSTTVSSVALTKSRQSATGPIYETVERFQL